MQSLTIFLLAITTGAAVFFYLRSRRALGRLLEQKKETGAGKGR